MNRQLVQLTLRVLTDDTEKYKKGDIVELLYISKDDTMHVRFRGMQEDSEIESREMDYDTYYKLMIRNHLLDKISEEYISNVNKAMLIHYNTILPKHKTKLRIAIALTFLSLILFISIGGIVGIVGSLLISLALLIFVIMEPKLLASSLKKARDGELDDTLSEMRKEMLVRVSRCNIER